MSFMLHDISKWIPQFEHGHGRASYSVEYTHNVEISLFQALCQCGRLKTRAGDERGLVEKEGTTGEPVSIVLKTSFRYTSSWYTL